MNPIDLAIQAGEIPPAETEYRFYPQRRWKFDYGWPDYGCALEIEGGGWVRGRHHRPKGYAADCEKYSMAASLGWLVIRATTEQVESGQALTWLKQAFALRRKQ